MKIQAVLEPSDEGGYTAFVPALSGCISEGDTEEEALTNIREAIDLYFEPIDNDNILCGEGVKKVELVV
uniref:Predicted nuclease of the RNAse H fold, HicB family n=1 Tax=Candidatus Kentrum eta TaxID=2126337 RepID=A0A450V6H7_9GAMM|nr:MAG: Predicted nuclease of the RNAse H fold, HicB family [Candidatus Kentron sp. H]VFJ95108.1 MAG: Predicted nuclease of the RNAse H fold, HicB family [Candidatus Kentron sp. H]VFK00366.1 MAG: Predicted nuclease of the RNAse H fold, HicB family [Candidatus Kentron sp. H]